MDSPLFANPPAAYRNAPFWSWNDLLDNAELTRQIEEMDAQGWGGFFMHSRVGLYTPYMTDEWMEHIQHCVAEAKRRNLDAWLYDEDRWPSGFAGGAVPALGPKYRQKNLVCAVDTIPDEQELVLLYSCYRCHIHPDDSLTDVQRIQPEEAEAARQAGYTVLYLYQRTHPTGYRRFNGYCYPDFLDPDVTDAFLESTHEKYLAVVGTEFGETIPGIFVDEPSTGYRSTAPRNSLQWTPALPDIFRKTYGYDLLEHLLSLFYDIGDFQRTRYDYWKLINELFRNNFTKRVYEWCDAHNLKLTGHFMAEDTISSQIDWTGGVMHHYEFMHYPGIDHLRRNIDNDITALQCSSVAAQLGKERILSEMYGAGGQNTSLHDLKWITDWHLAHGINFVNSHLSLYSMRGCRKRDWPPNIFIQQPYWSHMKPLSDYIARGCYAVSQGKPHADILLLHPLESGWIRFRPTERSQVRKLNSDFVQIIDSLLADQRLFHLGDETIMSQYGRVDDNRLVVGTQTYKTVIIPPCDTLRPTTLQLLKEFAAAGGHIIWVDQQPTRIDGRECENQVAEIEALGTVISMPDLLPCLGTMIPHEVCARRIETGANGAVDTLHPNMRVHVRKVDGILSVFMANSDKDNGCEVDIQLPKGRVTRWDLFTGEKEDLPVSLSGDHVSFTHQFEGAGSLLLTIDPNSEPVRRTAPVRQPVVWKATLPTFWRPQRLDPNALTLDLGQLRLESASDWSQPMYILDALRMVWEQQGKFSIRQTFHVRSIPKSVHLVIEDPQPYVLWCNGVELGNDRILGTWLDTNWTRLDISDLVREGENELVYSGTYRDDAQLAELTFRYLERQDMPYEVAEKVEPSTEIDPTYLIGDFGVWSDGSNGFVIDRELPSCAAGNLVGQGYPFYAGTIELQSEFVLPEDHRVRRVTVLLDDLEATVCSVSINGGPWQDVWTQPHKVESTHVRPGRNTIKLRLVNTLQNLLGPHHHAQGADLPSVSPNTFIQKNAWTDAYHFAPFGIGAVRILGYGE